MISDSRTAVAGDAPHSELPLSGGSYLGEGASGKPGRLQRAVS